ncbi:MAG: DUF5118 domain-containing protein [Pyrinomonadaceae bacterium]
MKRKFLVACAPHSFLCRSLHRTNLEKPQKTFASIVEKTQKIDGFIPLYVSREDNKIFMEITRFNKEFLIW